MPYLEKLESGNKGKQKKALCSFGNLVPLGNREAFEVLLDYLKALPPTGPGRLY